MELCVICKKPEPGWIFIKNGITKKVCDICWLAKLDLYLQHGAPELDEIYQAEWYERDIEGIELGKSPDYERWNQGPSLLG